MNDLKELYQEVILDHNKQPRNFYKMEGATHHAEGFNPLCGDQISLFLKKKGDVIEDVSFQGSGCAISKASSSMMTSILKGKKVGEAEKLFEAFHQMVTGNVGASLPEGLGKLAVFSGVCEFPARVKCASLAWHTLKAALAGSALEGKEEKIKTE